MRLYQGNAKELIGKKIDSYRRMGGYYLMPIPEREDDFNCVNYDFVVGDK